MADVRKLYTDLAEWADASNHPDKAQFEDLLSSLVQGILDRAIEETRKNANSGTEHIDLIKEYVGNKEYERFFTSSR